MSEPIEFNEPFTARMWAIVACEGQDDSFEDAIVVMMPNKERAETELRRRQALSVNDDDYADGCHAVLAVHVDAIGWNLHEPPPDGWPNQ